MLAPFIVLVALSSSQMSVSVAAQDGKTLDAAVSSVISGGYWENGKQRGNYRIIVRGGGWPRVPSTLRVEWIVRDRLRREDRVLISSAVDAIPDSVWSLSQPHLDCRTGACTFTIYGVDPHTDTMNGESWVIALRGPGELSVLKLLTPIRADWCVAQGEVVDSTFVVAQARSVLEDTLLSLKVHSVRRVEGHIGDVSLLEGFLVSLMPTRPMPGGGGLVWVDPDSGCPLVLKHYE